MQQALTEDELEFFLEILSDPIALSEVLFSDVNNLTLMNDNDFCHIRTSQLPLLSYENTLDYENSTSDPKEAFNLRKGLAEGFCFGGRGFGKSKLFQQMDILINSLNGDEDCGFSAYDQAHIKGVLDEVFLAFENHPFFALLEAKTTRSPNYKAILNNGYKLNSVNMNIHGKKEGSSFFGFHFTKLYIDEASMETETVYSKRRDAIAQKGCIYRLSGMTNFTKHSPAGRIFYDISNKSKILNYPQLINPYWDLKAREQAIKDFGGENSLGYRVFVFGHVVEDGVSVMDMERVRRNYDETKNIKTFEVTKETFNMFRHIIVLERPRQAKMCYVCADVGESAPTEIIIIFEIDKKFHYAYNITLFGLTDNEQYQVFRWLGETLNANVIANDCTDGLGRAIFRRLSEVFHKENLCWVSFNERIPVDIDKDDKGNLIIKGGVPQYKEEYTTEWSVRRMKELLYNERMLIPLDYKFDMQINNIVAVQSGVRIVYSCMANADHLWQAFQVFSIAQWYNEFNNIKGIRRTTFFKGGVG